jgi:hypothetical protein
MGTPKPTFGFLKNNLSSIDKIFALVSNIYEEEHLFTLSELRRIAKKAKSKNEAFDFMDHYQSNNEIFKKNLVAIMEIFGNP